MVDVSHASLTGSQLHEPKGVAAASLGEVYVADGAGSGNWSNVGTSSFTGMIADFTALSAPSGWIECDGSVISTATYSALYDVMTVQTTAARINTNYTLTGLASTVHMRPGYYVFGTGITAGTTIVSVDSATQITMSIAASSSGTSAIAVSPWLLGSGTIKLPDVYTGTRYRRSRGASIHIGQLQADQNQSHSHTYSSTSGTESVDHIHAYSGSTSTMLSSTTHDHGGVVVGGTAYTSPGGATNVVQAVSFGTSATANIDHQHSYSGSTGGRNQAHTHAISGGTSASGGTEARPSTLVVLTCVKT